MITEANKAHRRMLDKLEAYEALGASPEEIRANVDTQAKRIAELEAERDYLLITKGDLAEEAASLRNELPRLREENAKLRELITDAIHGLEVAQVKGPTDQHRLLDYRVASASLRLTYEHLVEPAAAADSLREEQP